MSKLFSPSGQQANLLALVYFLFGILLCFFSRSILLTFTRIMGGVLLIYGAWSLYSYFGHRVQSNTASFFMGIPCVVFGIVMLVSPDSLLAIVPVLGGVILIINSMIQMQKSFMLKSYGFENWLVTLILAVVLMVCGVIVLLRPIQTLSFIFQLVGICLIVEAVMIWYTQHEIKEYQPRL